MQPKKNKQGVGQNKNFGPIQKLSVPDFQHINNVFEQMQSEILEKPSKARKQMKPFTIRKATAPGRGAATQGQTAGQQAKDANATSGYGDRQNSRGGMVESGSLGPADMQQRGQDEEDIQLTSQEIASLQPKPQQVVNPWIHEQTHQEYLEHVTGLPARHANVIHKHKNVVKETTFLPKDDTGIDKDKATREALAIIEKEYEIFNDAAMPPVKALTRYDTWDQDRTPQEWLARCDARPNQCHAISPVFEAGEYGWKPVRVVGYDEASNKFKVFVGDSDCCKMVTRLSLLFYEEDPEAFRERVNLCKERQANVESELRFTNLVDSVSPEAVSQLSLERRRSFLNMCMRKSDAFHADFIHSTFTHLMQVVQEEYIRQMKKCIILKDMADPSNHERFANMKVPVRLSKRTLPYFGVVRCPKYPFLEKQGEIHRAHWCSDDAMCEMTAIFTQKYIDEFQNQRYLLTNKTTLKLPNELKDMVNKQNSHHGALATNMLNRWREFLVGEIQDRLGKSEKNPDGHEFNEEMVEQYHQTHLRRIILRFELIMNSYLRDFVKNSIDNWVSFIRSFTVPNYDAGELWARSNTPILMVHLAVRKPKDKKQKPKRRQVITEEMEEEEKEAILAQWAIEDEEYMNKIEYSPSMHQCQEFLLAALSKIVETTNKFQILETDLMQNLPREEKDKRANFQIDDNFAWVVDAKQKISAMTESNMVGPNALLQVYKKYEFLLNVDEKSVKKQFFNNPELEEETGNKKASIEVIHEEIMKYHLAADKIQQVSNNMMDYPMFRVQATKIKDKLYNAAINMRKALLDELSTWCNTTVIHIENTYDEMAVKISTAPTNERELVMLKEFIKMSKEDTTIVMTELLKTTNKHYDLLDEFSYVYKPEDIERCLDLKMKPMQIGSVIQDGSADMMAKEEEFMQRLDLEKDDFAKILVEFDDRFKQIIKFNSIDQIQDFSKMAFTLSQNIISAKEKIEQFNEREATFNQQISEYSQLDELERNFKPFYDLLETSATALQSIHDWTNQALITQEYELMEKSVSDWIMICFTLNRKLGEDYEETAEVAGKVKERIQAFQQNLPLIKCITSPAITEEDWGFIQAAVGNDSMDRDQVTVLSFETYNLATHFEEIEEITSRSEKKMQLNIKLQGYKKDLKDYNLVISRTKNGKTWILKAYDDVNSRLDDQIVGTQAMLGSSNMRGKLRNDAKAWETKLNNLSELIDEIGKCQRTWMYLEPIFASDDIGKTMPNEAAMFKEVDTLWKTTMEGIDESAGILDLIDRDNIHTQFLDANKKLDKIQKCLNDYLEEKRLVFPRFYFLASEDLLMLLAQTKDPKQVQPHMPKCFEGINKVRFDDSGTLVEAMISAEAETVNFFKSVDVNEGDKKGNVEKWMLEIEAAMRKTLAELTRDSLAEYYKIKRTEWVKNWPGQIILAVDQTDWTTGVETAIPKENGLEDYKSSLTSQIDDVACIVRGDLSNQLMTTLKAMVVIDVHARDVVSELITAQIQQLNEFGWASQLRYYWYEKGAKLDVSMVTATIPYGFEYLGNSLRLVITPLTDRCYRTLMGAKQLNYGGAPEGPAGTGKTESVKDLAKALAVQCVVFNCSSDMDYLMMAKFFKGQASSGCWNCFDEFNRINLEVLSVIAQQILTIQNAIIRRDRRFMFEGTDLSLNCACSVNITMNPGYAGRAELPDNLKALFRPCAMMVPDYILIGEVDLYSFGFVRARYLAIKVVASLRLGSEQLSSQDHYDFGMRALKAILTACGRLYRVLDWAEDQICLRALNDVNLPKFTSNDIPLYNGITSDLFPGVVTPMPDYTLLNEHMTMACKELGLQPKDEFLKKCIQLYETIMVRHGLMVVGGAFSGKTCVIKVLQDAFTSINDQETYVPVLTYFINPKSIVSDQLYGMSDPDTGEWTDGVLAIKIRDCAESETSDKKWVVFDGPVDAIWIENMNTVLDDNKKLCLNSGQIIKLKPTMTMMFEVEDLSHASPATVSRCGMVLLEPRQLGFEPLIQSYIQMLQTYMEEKVVTKVNKIMFYMCTLTMEFVRTKCTQAVPTGSNFMVHNILQIFDLFVIDYRKREGHETLDMPSNIEEICMNAIIFAAIWGVGGQLNEHTRPIYDEYLKKLIAGENVQEEYKIDVEDQGNPLKIPNKLGNDYVSLLEASFQPETCSWIHWLKTVPTYQVPVGASFTEVIVPTVDSIRIQYLLRQLLLKSKHTLIVGPTGTGKSITVVNELKETFQTEEWTYLAMSFSAQTTSAQTQQIIDGGMEKKRKGVYGPPLGKEGVIFVDDLNMPQKEQFGAQPPIELLRQWMDYGGWYDFATVDRDFRTTRNVRFAAAMGPAGAGRAVITNRYVRHFNVLYVEPYSDESMNAIYCSVMDWMFRSAKKMAYPASVEKLKENIVSSTIGVYNQIQKDFRPTPAKSHYTYNLRDVSKVFQGLAKSSPKAIVGEDSMIKLWAHECLRVFQDRLISMDDRDKFSELLQTFVKSSFKKDWEKLVTIKPLLFASFTPLIFPEGDDTKKAYNDVYCELTDRDKVKKVCEDSLQDYNVMNRAKKMDLVLFTDAIEHIVKVHRVITTELGHALLIGVGGSGRKSLTELATFIAAFTIEVLEMVKGYSFTDWREDMKNKLFFASGYEGAPYVFLFSDTQIINESFVEDINNILNNGEIPNLYNLEDYGNIIESVKEANKLNPDFKAIADDNNAVYNVFVKNARNNIHLVLAMSPIGDDFKRRLRMFPSLVNCCAIDWFLPWPQEALQSVATVFLSQVEDLPQLEGLIKICVDMQIRVQELTVRYREEMRRFYYVTPTSYLILIKTFTSLLGTKRNVILTAIRKFERGLEQLAKAQIAVAELQVTLSELIPVLEVKAAESAVMQKDIEIKKKSVDKEKEDCAVEESSAKKEKEAAEIIRKDCDEALANVMPIYQQAMAAVNSLSGNDVTELRGFKTAPAPALLVAKALCLMFQVKKGQYKMEPTADGKGKQCNWWETAKATCLTSDLLKKLQGFKKDEIDPQIIIDVTPIIKEELFQDAALAKASKAAHGIAKWVRAIISYDDAMKIVTPKKIELSKAVEMSSEAQKVWDSAKERLAAVLAEMKRLVEELEATQAEETRLRNNKDDCERKVELAKALITGLAEERENWKIDLAQRRIDKENLVGDIMISSGIIAYLGVFLKAYRDECTQQWATMLNEFHIQSTDNVSIRAVLGDPVKIREWTIHDLPSDDFSIDSAIIQDYSDRWNLFVDPQMQANIWLKNRHREDVKVIKPTQDSKVMSRTLENAISLGTPVIFEDATETFDPMLDPLLAKQIEKKGSEMYIKFGENGIPFSPDFKFYITTKMSRPHYSPEICVKVTMLNFMVTEAGLQDQMLDAIVMIEEQSKYEKRIHCIRTKAENQKKLLDLQDRILNQIANSSEDILEDRELKSSLDESKIQTVQIEATLKDMETVMKQIDAIRDWFTPVAIRVARLFFVLADLVNVDPMYQFSLEFYRIIYDAAIRSVEGVYEKTNQNKSKRRDYFIAEFTRRLYNNVCRSLFEAHKLLFSFLLCLKIMDENMKEEGGLPIAEIRFFMAGSTQVELTKPNPTGDSGWLLDKAWLSFLEMSSRFEIFKGFDDDFATHIDKWEEIYNNLKPQSGKLIWPGKWKDLSLLHRTIVMSILRTDKVIPMIQKIVKKQPELGKTYITPPSNNMEEIFESSTNKQPIMIVLSPGADPMTDIRNLSTLKKIKFESLSLGQGQAPKAIREIKKAQEMQTWVILQNCHLAPTFLPILDGLIEEIVRDPSSLFRIWLTTMPSDQFPVTIVQNSIKVTAEPPKGIRNNVRGFYYTFDNKEFEDSQKPIAFRRLLWGLVFFNALCLERKKFGPLGWNIPYAFSVSDLRISKDQLAQFLNHYDEIPYDALLYMVAEANYGGRVTDPQDRKYISTLLQDFYCPEMITEANHKLSESGAYFVPPDGQKEDYIAFIESKLPINDLTEIFGMHDNAEITSAINQTNEMLATALVLQPRASTAGGKSQEEVLSDLAAEVFGKLPMPFDCEYANKRHPICYEDSMNTVLQQELLRYNRLLEIVRSSLVDIGKAIKGEVIMSVELEEVGNNLFDNKVPAMWLGRSYPSLKPMASYVVDFVERLKFMQDWIEHGAPPSFWLSGFFFTQSFLTGVKQNYARKFIIAIDEIELDFETFSAKNGYDEKIAPENGAYVHGLFLEGVRWDSDMSMLGESMPKVLFTKLPHMYFKPAKFKDIVFPHCYTCPVYKTLDRRGTLSTTGHSTNFVCYIELPMQKRHTQNHWIKRGVALITQLND